MQPLYPLLMQPAFDPRPWGTQDLSPIYPNHKFSEKIGESWLTGDDCKVANGPLKGQSLSKLSEQYQRELVGDAARDPKRFPLLLKFLFPDEKLSVQVHPDDAQAQRVGQPWGKTECWYVAHAKPGSQIGLGLKPGVTAAQLEEAIHQNRAEEVLNWINVYPGDMIYVAGGTVHTLGPGSVIVETQQQSDTTYRLYDYGRPRELHLKDGMAAVKENVEVRKSAAPGAGAEWQESPFTAGRALRISWSTCLKRRIRWNFRRATNREKFGADSGGGGRLRSDRGPRHGIGHAGQGRCGRGSGAASASFGVRPQWALEFLRAYVPGKPLPEPETRM